MLFLDVRFPCGGTAGVGDPALLDRVGIPLVHALPDVGSNLQDHLQLRLVYRLLRDGGGGTINERSHSLLWRARMLAQYALHRSGPLSMAPSQMAAFARSAPGVPTPDLEFHIQPLSLDSLGVFPPALHAAPGITVSVCNLRPTSRGSVTVVSRDPRVAPEIAVNYLATASDRDVAVRSLRLARAIVGGRALAPYAPEESPATAGAASDTELLHAAGNIGASIFHPVGTCAMGSVVDSRLRVNGVDRLRVVDGSVMPTITSGNTATPIMMIAEKAARDIVEDDRL